MGMYQTVVFVRRTGNGPAGVLLVPVMLMVLWGARMARIVVVVRFHAGIMRNIMMGRCKVQPEEPRVSDG